MRRRDWQRRSAIEQAAAFFLATVERIEPTQWDAHGPWANGRCAASSQSTGGHSSAVEAYLDKPAAAVDLPDRGRLLRDRARGAQRPRRGGPAQARGRRGAGPRTPGAARHANWSRASWRLVAAADDSQLLTTPRGRHAARGLPADPHLLELVGAHARPRRRHRRHRRAARRGREVTIHLTSGVAVRTGKAAPVLLLATEHAQAGFSTI